MMKAFTPIKNGISFILPVLLFVYGYSNPASHTPQNHVVEIKDMKFQPAELKVQKGDTVTWINKDIVVHDVTQQNRAWTSPKLKPDATWKKVITNSDSYFCSIHMMMKGNLKVE